MSIFCPKSVVASSRSLSVTLSCFSFFLQCVNWHRTLFTQLCLGVPYPIGQPNRWNRQNVAAFWNGNPCWHFLFICQKIGCSQEAKSKNPFPAYSLLRTEASQVCSYMIGIVIKHLVGAECVQESKRSLKPKRAGKSCKMQLRKPSSSLFPTSIVPDKMSCCRTLIKTPARISLNNRTS